MVLIVLPLAGFLAYSLFRVEGGEIVHQPSLANYARFFGEGVFLPVFAAHLPAGRRGRGDHACSSAIRCAIWLASLEGRRKLAMTLAFAVPLLMSYIIKIYAIRAILGGQGWLNRLLLWTRLIIDPDRRLAVQPHRGADHALDPAPALHHPADLRRPGAHPAQPVRGLGRSRRRGLDHVPARDLAAVAPRAC